jgi:hypothetical protein
MQGNKKRKRNAIHVGVFYA